MKVKNVVIASVFFILGALGGMSSLADEENSSAGTWIKDQYGWYFQEENGTIWVDRITPDGHWIGKNGYWVSDSGIDEAKMAEKSAETALIVYDKTSHQLELWKNGERLYNCLGTAGAAEGDKEIEGDWKTPEGEFYICKRNDKSQYYKALGLSYPDTEDAKRGLDAGIITEQKYNQIAAAIEQKEKPDWYTPLGGEIMIHGERNESDKTRGCISISNEDIDIIWEHAQMGITVIIQD